jgi:hypothetical protein
LESINFCIRVPENDNYCLLAFSRKRKLEQSLAIIFS